MKLEIGLWGFSIELPFVEVRLFLGDMYIFVRGVGEAAWNSTGIYAERHKTSNEGR